MKNNKVSGYLIAVGNPSVRFATVMSVVDLNEWKDFLESVGQEIFAVHPTDDLERDTDQLYAYLDRMWADDSTYAFTRESATDFLDCLATLS